MKAKRSLRELITEDNKLTLNKFDYEVCLLWNYKKQKRVLTWGFKEDYFKTKKAIVDFLKLLIKDIKKHKNTKKSKKIQRNTENSKKYKISFNDFPACKI